MAVSSEDNKVGYLASGNSTYPIPFYFESASHIKLFVDDVEKVLNTHYSVTGAGLELGGELTVIETPYTGNASVIILRDVPLTQGNSLNDGGPNAAETTEKMFDKLTHIAQQINEKAERAIKMPLSFTALNPQITGDITPGAIIEVNEAGDGLKMGQSTASFITTLDGKVADAQAAQAAAETAQGLSETAQAASESAQLASETAKTAAELAETNAEGSASAAAGSASLAQQAADSVLFNDVIFITAGMSPVNVDDFYRGAMLACDCSLGPIEINLPEISTLDLNFPWTVSIKKTDSSGNSITVNRAGTNLIDEGTSKTIGSAGSGLTLIPDADPNPDVWTSAEFGAAAGNITTDPFSGDGVQTAFTLSVAPGSKNNTQVYIHGVYQQKNTYSISGVTLTFDEAPIEGVDNIEVNIGTLLPIGTPADGTVTAVKVVDSSLTLSKLAQEVINFLLPVGTKIESIRQDTPAGFVSGMNKSLGKTVGDYIGSDYFALYSYVWEMPGLSTTAGHPFKISSAKGASALADWDAGKTIVIDFETNEVFVRATGVARVLGSYQDSDNKAHSHTATSRDNGASSPYSGFAGGAGGSFQTITTNSTGSTESRPKNVALNVYFKY